MLKYLTINTSAEWICFIVACICLIRDKSPVWRGMILFLLITGLSETLGICIKGQYLADPENVRPNVWVYNILLIFQAGFISAMFASLLKVHIKSGPVILIGLALLSILYINEQVEHGIFKKHAITTIVMSVLFIVYSYYYFYLLLRDERNINLTYYPGFWWVAGILFFYFGSIITNLYYEKIRDFVASPKPYLRYIYNVLNVLLYACWSYSFILRRWPTTR